MVVEVDGEGHLGLAYDKLTAVLVRAVQEEHAGRHAADDDASAVDHEQLMMIEAQQRQMEAATAVAERLQRQNKQQQVHIEEQQVQNEEQQRQIEELQKENDVMKGRVKRLRRLETEVGTFNEQAILNEQAFMEQAMKNELARQQHDALMGQIEELQLLVFGQTKSDAY